MKLMLKDLRKQAGFTQRELAEKLNVEWRTYGAWERGESTINAKQLCNICEVIGCTPNDLLGWKVPYQGDSAEQALVDAYRGMDSDKRRIMQSVSDVLSERQ